MAARYWDEFDEQWPECWNETGRLGSALLAVYDDSWPTLSWYLRRSLAAIGEWNSNSWSNFLCSLDGKLISNWTTVAQVTLDFKPSYCTYFRLQNLSWTTFKPDFSFLERWKVICVCSSTHVDYTVSFNMKIQMIFVTVTSECGPIRKGIEIFNLEHGCIGSLHEHRNEGFSC